VSDARSTQFPLGAAITLEQLEAEPYDTLAALRTHEPVSWLPALSGWFVTTRVLGVEVMRNANTYSVDDERFTTAAVLGPSMLSVDGSEHNRHRLPFAPAFRPAVLREQFEEFLSTEARRLVMQLAPAGAAELRTTVAGPLAVSAIAEFLGLVDVSHDDILAWYSGIASAIVALTTGHTIADEDATAVLELRRQIDNTLQHGANDSLLRQVQADGRLHAEEVTSAAAVLMFGAIETAEGMTANALAHLLSRPDVIAQVRSDRSAIAAVIEESLRLEPAAAFVDRYATTSAPLGGVTIPAGELVTVSLLAANRDPAVFDRPDDFVLNRSNVRQHVAFVQGPHACIGPHLARLETNAAIEAVINCLDDITLDPASTTPASGLIFRKPHRVQAQWSARSVR
jgi:cytochrome P450